MSASVKPASFADINEGDTLPSQTWTVTKADIAAFGEFLYPPQPDNPQRKGNPHIDEEYARQSIYGGLFVDGNQTVAFLCRMATDWLPAGTLARGWSDVDVKFPNPCRIDDVITFTGKVVAKTREHGRDQVKLEVLASNQAGKPVAAGFISAQIPR
ncbi:MAG: hypothetical protein A3H35_20750 [Betaproteobacteria bacterium RIFCSPLOWO2_02_FULL_62_17]|nr:MAG: hypothetical protein A3H35_20750 [Betaproteobacteria bacterium RIFCSPLOWO2_02_FULL_62_17]